MKKAHALAIGREIPGERWARAHADDKKPVLAAALEVAFDIQKNSACIALDQAARDSAAAWLPPGMRYSDTGSSNNTGSTGNGTAAVTDPDADTDASADLPAFLTDDQHAHAPNGAAT